MGNILSYFAGNESEINFKKYGWRPDTPDRDLYLIPDNLHEITDVSGVDLRNMCPGIYNQGKLGSCTANAIAAMYEFDEIKQDENNLFIPSVDYLYITMKEKLENTIEYDSGAQIEMVLNQLIKSEFVLKQCGHMILLNLHKNLIVIVMRQLKIINR